MTGKRTAIRAALVLQLCCGAAALSAAERSFPVGRFDSIRLTDITAVDIVTGEAVGVTAQGERAELDRLVVSDEGGILDVAPQLRGGLSAGAARVRLRITVPMINHVALRGAGAVSINRVAAPGFTAALAGPGRIDIAAIDVQAASFTTAGSGSIVAAGRCRDAKAASTGSGDIDIARLRCATLVAETAGSGDIRGFATTSAKVTITGGGNVGVSGGARCTVSAIGSGKANCG
ncbi:hypothetical protein EUV02_08590 [Polymorphobacter arshaanensis]|uniref:Putative auto-transporter adhesin head GIN domain-containing protein n=1 Tax=Glacieibacterium arshaanense TaxID=2511025 RepID=A0A4Y9ENG8_9SPHN|nr:DUF2807 domain-containing protein [Polymorphobacter arshaanensis]TFU03240.1 hypothetical protein EUV02_08590 [Polymorphobacter arshaanensis]